MYARERMLKDWFSKIGLGEIELPRFQRYEAWNYNLIAGVITNVINSLPIGSCLILEVGDKPPFVSRPISGAPEGKRITELLLDGQQRLTALWKSLHDGYPDRIFMIYIPEKGEEEEGPYAYHLARWEKGGKKYPLWVDDPKRCWEGNLFPARLLNPSNDSEYQIWAKEAARGDVELEMKISRDIILGFREKVKYFQLPFLGLESNTPKEISINVFINLNTSYVKLSPFNIVVAQLEEETGESFYAMIETLTNKIPAIGRFIDPSDVALPVLSLLQDKVPKQKSYYDLDLQRVGENWGKIVGATERFVNFLNEEKIFDWKRLPTGSIIAPLIALFIETSDKKPDEIGNIKILFRKYLWRAFFTSRYDKATSNSILQDYRVLKKVIQNEADEKDVPCFNEEEYSLPEKEELVKARWPAYRDRVAIAILLLSLRGGAEDISDSSVISPENINIREYHHIYPRAWLKQNKVEENDANIALNCMLVNYKSHRTIGAKEPVEYLLEKCEANILGRKEIERRLRTHFIDYGLMAEGDYKEFIEKRAEAYLQAINALCNGEVWSP